jgi:CubicO group peptidase (beta-lactamase class C family)
MRTLVVGFCLVLLYQASLFAQVTDLVKSEGITSPLHQRNIGRVTFMGTAIPIDRYTESDFLRSLVLTDTSELNLRVYLGNSLTNYLHALDESLPAEDLVAKGNFQFTFYVDGKLVYREQLNPGAYGKENKNTRTVFRVPLISPVSEDHWGRFLWNRFLLRGGEDALSEGRHRLRIEIKPYLRTSDLRVGETIAEGDIELVVPKIDVPETKLAVQKIQPGSGWIVSNESIDSSKIRDLNRQIAINRLKKVTSVVVIKNGKLLLEEYFNGADRSTLHDTRSVGKSFASALIGLAIKEKHLKSEAQTLSEFYALKDFKNWSPEKERISLRDLLTMSSAFDGSDSNDDSPGNEEKMYPTENWVKFALDLPVDRNRVNGKQWDYFTAGVVLLGDILDKSVPGGLEKFAREQLFAPLGITNYQWQYTPQKVVNTAGGLAMSSLDLAKFGQLYKNNGSWERRPILPPTWVAQSLSHHLPIPERENEFYGYLFWNKTYSIGSDRYEAYYASGNGGNKIVIFKDQPLVIVITSTAFNTPYAHPQADKIINDYLLPAIFKR